MTTNFKSIWILLCATLQGCSKNYYKKFRGLNGNSNGWDGPYLHLNKNHVTLFTLFAWRSTSDYILPMYMIIIMTEWPNLFVITHFSASAWNIGHTIVWAIVIRESSRILSANGNQLPLFYILNSVKNDGSWLCRLSFFLRKYELYQSCFCEFEWSCYC